MTKTVTEDIFYFITSIIGMASFFFTDILFLRALYLVASILFVISGIIFRIEMMIIMNSLYIAVNAFQIFRLMLERTAILIPEELKKTYSQVFSNMKPREFLNFLKLGVRKVSEKNQLLCREKDTKDILMFVLQGTALIEKEPRFIELSDNFFIGEMRFLTQKPMTANVRAETVVHYIEWSYKSLAQLKNKKPDIYTKFLAALARDLVRKLQTQNYREVI